MNFSPLQSQIEKLRSFNAQAVVEKIVSDNTDKLTDLQREQLAEGVDITGRPRVDEYRPLTKYLKKKFGSGLGAVTDRVTFFMTGKLYQSLKTITKSGKFETVSERFTFDKMIERVGDENFGLDPDSRKEFAENVTIPEFKKELERQTGLK